MAQKEVVRLIEFDRNQLVVDTPMGRLVVEPHSVRFQRTGEDGGRPYLLPSPNILEVSAPNLR